MDALEFLKEEKRMCNHIIYEEIENCTDICPVAHRLNGKRINCVDFKHAFPDEYVAKVEEWSKTHPKDIENEGR